MTYFPQLSSGAMSQFPLRRKVIGRTVTNQCADGRTVKAADPSPALVEWHLRLQNLTGSEAGTLEQFYVDVEGRLRSFTFLDPADNLLVWSGDPTNTVWEKDPAIGVAGDVGDPFGGNGAWSIGNPSGIAQRVKQRLSAPGWFTYCWNFYARSSQSGAVTLFRDTAASSASAVQSVGTSWRRLQFGGKSENSDEEITFGVELPAGASADFFGFQVEPQIGASGYRRTTSRSGIYLNARFRDDLFFEIASSPNHYGCTTAIVARA